jgi:2-haloacid dehalogenase/putative hydrolase of the HAD superfamily
MALPKQITLVTFDVYGTLIDWEQGIVDAFEKEAARDGFTIDRDQLISNFHEIEREIEGGSYAAPHRGRDLQAPGLAA